MILPSLGRLISGKAGRIRAVDIAILLFSFWCVLSLAVNNGIGPSAQTSGIILLETVGPYLLARCYVRDADAFHNMVQLLFGIVCFLLPFAIIEFVSGLNILHEICPLPFGVMAERYGLTRVQSVFDHPILFGVFTGSIFAMAYLVLGYRESILKRVLRIGIIGATTFLSLSAGPIIAVIAQGILLLWNSLLGAIKYRWTILISLLLFIFVSVQGLANRSLPAIVSGYLTFDPQSYWFRTVIWFYGSEAALNHPIFGVGLNNWERPAWMPSSIDDLWLLLAVKYGLAAPSFLLLALLSIFLAVGLKNGLNDRIDAHRTAFLITLTAFFLVAWTVTFWDAAYVLFLFLMGSGVWILDVRPEEIQNNGLRVSPRRLFAHGGITLMARRK
jgi:hypothetical protein